MGAPIENEAEQSKLLTCEPVENPRYLRAKEYRRPLSRTCLYFFSREMNMSCNGIENNK